MNKFFKPTRLKTWQIFVLLGAFLLLLIVGRLWWANTFSDPKEVHLKNGYLDLTEWDKSSEELLSLNGEWNFYPQRFITDPSVEKTEAASAPVPNGWVQETFPNKEAHRSFGYGTYHLHIKVNPDKNEKYSIQFPSIRSSSILYVNGDLEEQNGLPTDSKDTYKAKNKPFKTTLHPDSNGNIDIALQVANYDDIRKGGIARNPKFGAKDFLTSQFDFSIFMQIVVIMLLIIHGMYAILLFLLGNHNKKLIFIAFLFLSIAMVVGLGFNEKIFVKLFPINYLWSFRLVNLTGLSASLFLLLSTDYKTVRFWRKIHPIYIGATAGVGLILLLTNVSIITMLIPVIYFLVLIAIGTAFISLFKMMIYEFQTNILLLFAIVAIFSYAFWTLYWADIGKNVPYYPFELIIAIMCMACLWFWYFFKVYHESKMLASELQEINDSKDQFLANTAHEFKNPLHSILNITHSVLQNEKHHLRSQSSEGLTTVLSVGKRLSVLLDDLMDVRYLHKQVPKLNKETVLAPAVVTGVFDMLRYDAKAKRIDLKNDLPQDFPLVLADENRLVQILFNLLQNSVKFTEEGTITVKGHIEKDKAYITVADTGSGMEPSYIGRLLQPYEQQKESEASLKGGFGLGLYISKQLIELHGGTMAISSTPNVGTEVTFALTIAENNEENIFFPVSEQSILSRQTSTANIQRTDTFPSHSYKDRKSSILIVDDNPVNLHVIETLLPTDKYNIQKATSGKEALQLLHTIKWDLLITDVMMPEMSGYTLTSKVRDSFQLMELPVLLLTAKNHPGDYQKGFLAGANDYVTKPVEPVEFKARVDALVAMKQTTENQQQLETSWLQAQIQPHFIFNVLNSIIALSEIDLDRMRNLTHEFSVFLRSKFEFQHMQELIPLSEEVSLVESYVYIEKIRFQNRLHIEWKVDNLEKINIPYLTVQPLVENAINHGVMKRSSGGTVRISIVNATDEVEIIVEDNGIGMNPDQIEALFDQTRRSGVGFINTNQRLKKHFGEELQIKSEINKGTKISFRIPRQSQQT